MTLVTIRVIDGADRGKVFENLPLPVTIGREEGNSIQLNDERVSRFHVKIQEDNRRLVLTDLESTNGTKVNGEEIRLRILRFGDIVALGRSVLLVGSQKQIARRLARLRSQSQQKEAAGELGELEEINDSDFSSEVDLDLSWTDDPQAQSSLQCVTPPEIPTGLSPGQAAQLSDLLSYIHIRIRDLIRSGQEQEADRFSLEQGPWQNLLDLQSRLARYLRQIGEPHEPA